MTKMGGKWPLAAIYKDTELLPEANYWLSHLQTLLRTEVKFFEFKVMNAIEMMNIGFSRLRDPYNVN